MKLAFFDAKPYDRPGFDAHAAGTGLEIRYFETKLGEDTVQLARGFDGVCVFVNDTVNAKVAGELYDLGVRVVALRCAGFNNVDTKACCGKLHVFRVPAYSPYAVAEHAMALLRSPAAPKMYEIAEQVGFGNNVQYFFTMFKRYAGVTPKDYQENPAVIV